MKRDVGCANLLQFIEIKQHEFRDEHFIQTVYYWNPVCILHWADDELVFKQIDYPVPSATSWQQ